MFNQTNYI